MKVQDILQETYTALSANKARSGLTILGIVIGIGSVIAVVLSRPAVARRRHSKTMMLMSYVKSQGLRISRQKDRDDIKLSLREIIPTQQLSGCRRNMQWCGMSP